MSQRQISIADMQCWVFHHAQRKWNLAPAECAVLFRRFDLLGYISECYDLLHVSSYQCALKDTEDLLRSKGGLYDPPSCRRCSVPRELYKDFKHRPFPLPSRSRFLKRFLPDVLVQSGTLVRFLPPFAKHSGEDGSTKRFPCGTDRFPSLPSHRIRTCLSTSLTTRMRSGFILQPCMTKGIEDG